MFNKADLAPDEAKRLVDDHPGSVAVSAVTGEGIDDFLRTLGDRLRALDQRRRAARSRTTAATCSPPSTARARCVSTTHDDDGVRVRARLGRRIGRPARRVRRRARLTPRW